MSMKLSKKQLRNAVENKETLTFTEARAIAFEKGVIVSRATLVNWIERFSLGHQPAGNGGRWYIFKDKFIDHITGKKAKGE